MFQATINRKKVMAIKDVDARRRRVWMAISKKDIPKVLLLLNIECNRLLEILVSTQ